MVTLRYWGSLATKLRPVRGTRAGQNAAESAPVVAPASHALGAAYTTPEGLRVTVAELRREETQGPPCAGEPARLALRARIENPTLRPVEFDNLLGVLDGAGHAHPRGYTDPARYPSALPGVATLNPGAAIEGDVYVQVDAATPQPFCPALLVALAQGCAGCPGGPGVSFVPLARWQPVRL